MKRSISTLLLLLLTIAPAHAQKQVYEYRVLRPDGAPAIGAKVRAWLGDHRWITGQSDVKEREVATRTDAGGKFKVEAQNDEEAFTLLMVDAPGCAIGFWNFLPASDTPLKLSADTPIKGKVVSENGHPVAGADVIVSVVGVNTYVPVYLQDPRHVRYPGLTTYSGGDGSFRLRGATLSGFSDELQLWATGKIGGRGVMGTTGRFHDKSYSITVYPDVSVNGQVVHYATGKPLPGARVEYSDYNWPQEPRLTDMQGRFRFDNLPGHFARSLTVTHPDFPSAIMQVSTDRGAIDDRQMLSEIVIGLRPMAKVSGKIVDEDTGNPLPFGTTTQILWTQKSAAWTHSVGGAAATRAAEGSFEFLAPVGSTLLKAGDPFSGHFAEGKGALAAYQMPLEVPVDGLRNLVIKVRRQPGYLVHNEKRTGDYPPFTIYKRTPEREEYLLSGQRLWFLKAEKWGETMEIRGVGEGSQKEVFPWTKITAAPDQWPTVIAIP